MPATTSPRASPDALLALAKREGRGRLKIYLGAAPGVGKTYAMLTAARTARDDGQDVVLGLVETHGRRETEALVAGFELQPRRPIVYRNQMMQEFDLDAALARKPGLLLVDEYAHTNVPGSRHPKRWQDIDELLAAGVDVWTTLNIQHLESLNEVIQKITKVRVRETIPDTAFDAADELVLVDFPPDELLRRLAEGKVYVQDTAARAVESFFKPQNLTALRELALRRAAERIDATLVQRMQANAIEGPWAAGERLLVCVGSDSDAMALIRSAKRLANLMDAPWIAVTVERPGAPPDHHHVDEALQLALTLGAEVRRLVAQDFAAELLRVARFENVTQIVIGRARRSFKMDLFRRSLAQELVLSADGIAIHVVTGNEVSPVKTGGLSLRMPLSYLGYSVATGMVGVALFASKLLERLTPLPNISLVFLVAVLVPAVFFGVWPAVFASVLSFLAYNFFFIEPLYTFTVAAPHELLALVIFLGVAIITSALAGRARSQARVASGRVRAMRRLYEFTRRLSGLAGVDQVAEGAVGEIHTSLDKPAILLLEENGELRIRAAWPPEDDLDPASMSAARWAVEKAEPAGNRTSTLPLVPWLFLPLRTARGSIGAIGVVVGKTEIDSEVRALLDTLAEQAAAALERSFLSRDMVATQGAIEAEQVRNTVLASISHDFRTPLASILGAATGLIDVGDKLGPEARMDLLKQIKQEVEHLDGMVRNLLSITRIDAGALELRKDWNDLREIADRVASAARRRGAVQTIDVMLPSDLPLVHVDAILIEQALSNIVGNAVAHTPQGTRIAVTADIRESDIDVRVTDDGLGIAPELLPRVFDKFVSAPAEADRSERTGLGLAIAKGIMEAHGGEIAVESPPPDFVRGTRVTLRLPKAETPV